MPSTKANKHLRHLTIQNKTEILHCGRGACRLKRPTTRSLVFKRMQATSLLQNSVLNLAVTFIVRYSIPLTLHQDLFSRCSLRESRKPQMFMLLA